MTLQITRPELQALIQEGLRSGRFTDAEDLILQALRSIETEPADREERRREAIERLRSFGKRHGLSLGGLTIRQLRDEARP